jgi:hypothetical protein
MNRGCPDSCLVQKNSAVATPILSSSIGNGLLKTGYATLILGRQVTISGVLGTYRPLRASYALLGYSTGPSVLLSPRSLMASCMMQPAVHSRGTASGNQPYPKKTLTDPSLRPKPRPGLPTLCRPVSAPARPARLKPSSATWPSAHAPSQLPRPFIQRPNRRLALRPRRLHGLQIRQHRIHPPANSIRARLRPRLSV